jgi:hypothetical protein
MVTFATTILNWTRFNERGVVMIQCQNCNRCGDEEDFSPSDGNPAPVVCPECGQTNCFTTFNICYHFTRDHKPGEYVAFEARMVFEDSDGCISSIEDEQHYELHIEEGTQIFWGVYGRTEEGLAEHLGDFSKEEDALDTVRKLGGKVCSSW